MEKLEITSMSSRGQVVIPLDIREQLGLKEGEKFIVVGEDDTVILKKVTMPSFKNFNKLLQKTQQFAKEKGITKADVESAIKRTRRWKQFWTQIYLFPAFNLLKNQNIYISMIYIYNISHWWLSWTSLTKENRYSQQKTH